MQQKNSRLFVGLGGPGSAWFRPNVLPDIAVSRTVGARLCGAVWPGIPFGPVLAYICLLRPNLARFGPDQLLLVAGARLGADQYLQQWGPRIFPSSFSSLLHPFMASLASLSPDARVAAFDTEFDALEKV